jgi:hypothetical protein
VIGNDSREASAMDTFTDELAASHSTARLDAIRDDWMSVLTQHLRGDKPTAACDLVRVTDHKQLGVVTRLEVDQGLATVDFGGRAVEVPAEEVQGVSPHGPSTWATAADLRDSIGDDPWAHRILDYLDRVNNARAERAQQLAQAAAGVPWTLLVEPSHLPAVAYHRDRSGLDDELRVLGSEPAGPRMVGTTQRPGRSDRHPRPAQCTSRQPAVYGRSSEHRRHHAA